MMKAALQKAIARLNQGRVLVVGDIAIDEMVYGTTARLSREAPVLILHHERSDIILGAAGNAAHNIAALGAKRTAIAGVSGKDYYHTLLSDALLRDGIDIAGLIQDEDRPTTTKTRISGIANHSVTQQIIRIDREDARPLSPLLENRLLDRVRSLAPDFDALLLSDYGIGVMTDAVIHECRRLAKSHGLILSVDSQQNLNIFQGADIITPNQPEAEQNVGYSLDGQTAHRSNLIQGGLDLLQISGAENILITRGEAGMMLFERKETAYTDIPVFNKSAVFDVTGAGDTVVGTLLLALATGTDMLTACVLGNLAASLVVQRFGASTTDPAELLDTLEKLAPDLLAQIHREPLPDKTPSKLS
jgi:rfaE bifunctional protein kinase chain/domain